VQNKKKVNEMGEDVSADAPPRNCSSSVTESACPPDGFAPSARFTTGADTIAGTVDRPQPQHAGTHHAARPPLRFFDADGTEVTRTDHLPPPVLGADNDTVSDWLRQGAVR
jgi:hypothetical protein